MEQDASIEFVAPSGIVVRQLVYSREIIHYETAPAGIRRTPEELARHFGMCVELDFDDLDYFYFLLVEVDGAIMGFRRHWGARPGVCDVCDLSNVGVEGLRARLSALFPGEDLGFTEYNELW